MTIEAEELTKQTINKNQTSQSLAAWESDHYTTNKHIEWNILRKNNICE